MKQEKMNIWERNRLKPSLIHPPISDSKIKACNGHIRMATGSGLVDDADKSISRKSSPLARPAEGILPEITEKLCAWREEGKSPLTFIAFLRCIRPKEKEQLLLGLFNS